MLLLTNKLNTVNSYIWLNDLIKHFSFNFEDPVNNYLVLQTLGKNKACIQGRF